MEKTPLILTATEIEKAQAFVKLSDRDIHTHPSIDRALGGAVTDEIGRGPFHITGAWWAVDYDEADREYKKLSGGADIPVGGHLLLQISDADGCTQINIPADEEDGHSGGEAFRAILALNEYGALQDDLRAIQAIASARLEEIIILQAALKRLQDGTVADLALFDAAEEITKHRKQVGPAPVRMWEALEAAVSAAKGKAKG